MSNACSKLLEAVAQKIDELSHHYFFEPSIEIKVSPSFYYDLCYDIHSGKYMQPLISSDIKEIRFMGQVMIMDKYQSEDWILIDRSLPDGLPEGVSVFSFRDASPADLHDIINEAIDDGEYKG